MENRIKVNFSEGESVRIISGPFEDFMGVFQEISAEKGKMKVSVSMFGRDFSRIDFLQVSFKFIRQSSGYVFLKLVGLS